MAGNEGVVAQPPPAAGNMAEDTGGAPVPPKPCTGIIWGTAWHGPLKACRYYVFQGCAMHRALLSLLAIVVSTGLLAVALPACGGKSSGPSASPPVLAGEGSQAVAPLTLQLPSPSELAKQASVPGNGDLYRSALSSYFMLPSANTSVQVTFRQFDSNWTPGGGLAGTAYAGYQFTNMTGYNRTAGTRLFFNTPPADPDNLYFALANYATDTWDWFMYDPAGFTPVPGMDDYISSAGNTYLMLLLTGTDTMKLDKLIISERLDIDVVLLSDLEQNPALNVAPRTVAFDASLSSVLGGTVTSFDFDFDNDSVLDVTGDTDGQESYAYTAPGAHTCRVVVHDDGGQTAEKLQEFWLVNPANTGPTPVMDADTTSGNAPLTVNLSAANSTDDTGITWYRWDMNSDGEYEYASEQPELTYTFARGGVNWVTLQVEDEDFATATAQEAFTVTGGFALVEVASGINMTSPMDIAMCSDTSWLDDYATVAFQTSPDRDLKVAKATNVSAMNWGPAVDAADPSKDTGYSPVLVKGSMERPVVVFGEKTGGEMKLVAAWPGTAETQQYGVWNGPWTIDGANETGGGNAIAERGGVLHVASIAKFGYQGQQSMYYYRSNGTTGNSWDAPVLLKAGPGSGGFGEVAVTFSRFLSFSYPAVAFAQWDTTDIDQSGFGVFTTVSLDGTTWDESKLYTGYDTYFIGAAQLPSYHPLVVAGRNLQYGSLMYSATSTTTTGGTWPDDPVTAGERGFYCDVAIIGGVPVVCFQDSRSKLQYVVAADAMASAWNDAIDVDLHGRPGYYCAMAERAPGKPVIVYYESDDDMVKVATWQ